MEAGYILKLENPKAGANVFSKLFFLWMIKICHKGTKKGLEVVDLYKSLNCDNSEKLTDKLEKNWENEVAKAKQKGGTPSLLRAIFKTFIATYMFYGMLLFIHMICFRSVQPLVLAYFIALFEDPTIKNYDTEMYVSGAILALQSFFIVVLRHHADFGNSSIGMRIRISVSSLVYRKILKLSKKSLGQTAAGQVVNMLSNDVNRFDMVTLALHYLWIIPFQVSLVTYFIWTRVGISSLAGVGAMILLTIPVQGYLGKLTSKFRLQVATRTDSRVKLMNEVISGIQVIKMYAWEKPFEAVIKLARKIEIVSLTKASYLRAVFLSAMVFVERLTLYLTIICYVLLGNVITADKVFSMAQFFNSLQQAMAILYPMAITFGAEALVSIKRLQDFLVLEEKPKSIIEQDEELGDIHLVNVEASWTTDHYITLNCLNLVIPEGKLCAIIGPVGAGKSSLLQLLLGELMPTNGNIKLSGTISYASQEAWLFAASVRQNILFGQEYNKLLYRNVVRVCALEKDFEQFPQGDKTLVGERGASLSGGQRARINLARAVYRHADIYLLDDPLSAVDTNVGKHLFDECIKKHLKRKTRILVTHQLQYLKNADIIIVLNDGTVEAQGTFEELSKSKLDFTKLLVAADETHEKEQLSPAATPDRNASLSKSLISEQSIQDDTSIGNQEEMGSADATPFKDYVKASGNYCTLFCLASVLILAQASCSGADYWVTFWTQQEAQRHANGTEPYLKNESNETYKAWYDDITDEVIIENGIHPLVKTNIAIYIYTGLIVAAVFLTLLRSMAYFKMAMIASKNLHNKMFHALLKVPMRFFDTNPSGRVLNRFSKDMGAIDELLPRVLIEAIQILLVMSGILIMVTLANYYMIIAMAVLGLLFLKVCSWYVMTAKDVKHLEGITKSPVFSHLSSSLNGITTIRASQAEGILRKEFDHHQDVHTSAWFLTIAIRSCFGIWLDLICVLFVAVVVFSFILMNNYFGPVSGSFVGLAISQALILTGMLQYGMRQIAEVVNQLTSVERIMQYTKLEHEEKLDKSLLDVEEWPSMGLVEFEDVSLHYSETDRPVLKHLNFVITPGNKIGIVGRTGAGKSSLIQALFRLAPTEGHIYIDKVDTKDVLLQDLRKKISIIPQEPVLFSATLRYNLDPFDEFGDTDLWNALEEVELKEAVPSLDFMVTEGGGNFSLGQKQLVCLARAILRNNRVLVLDEATANIDPQTDALIQATIRRKFKDCSVLTIAHRLNTIMDSDKVLVMEAGQLVEFDHPHILLQNPVGYFTKMVAETGPTMSSQLSQISCDFYLSTIAED